MEEKILVNETNIENEELTNDIDKALTITGVNELSTGLFASEESHVRKMTSLDLSKEKNIDMIINANQDVDFKLNECIGQEITVIGCMATERLVDVINEETGEMKTIKKHTLMLFDKDGKSYVTGSNACYLSFEMICSLKGLPTESNPLVFIPIKTDAKEKGHSYLKLKLKTK